MQSTPHITIIIPAYNEEKRIAETLLRYGTYYNKQYRNRYDILVVLNGCKDKTEDVVKQWCKKNSHIHYINFSDAIGKGGAIIEGLRVARGNLVGYTDADGSTRPEIMHRLFGALELTPSIDCVVGSRWIEGAVVQQRTLKRQIMSRLFHVIVALYFHLGIKDTQCGAKVIRKQLIPKILPHLNISNMAFDVNFLVDIKRAGGHIFEMPIEWEDDTNSTISHPMKTGLVMFLSITRLRLLYSPLRFLYPLLRPISDVLYSIFTVKK